AQYQMKRPIRVLVVGARGRMGQAILEAATREPSVTISAQCDLGDALATVINESDVVIDFSATSATAEVCHTCVQQKRPIVIGTTGHSSDQSAAIQMASKSVPVVFAPNFSVGVNVLFWLARKTAELLGSDFDLEIIEMHHRLKKDAPSGTAKRLAEILGDVRKIDLAQDVRHGREGMVGERSPNEIGIHALRGGDVVGEHRLIFAGSGERLE